MAMDALMVLIQEGSSMKKFAFLSAFLFLAAFILLPGIGTGKYNAGKPAIADGWPLPPPIPPSATTNTLMADGWPLPPPIPPGASAEVSIA